MFRPFGFIALKDFKIIWLSNISILSLPDEGYSKKRVVSTKFDIYVFIYIIIIIT